MGAQMRRQSGAIGFDQLHELGFSAREVQRLRSSGALRAERYGIAAMRITEFRFEQDKPGIHGDLLHFLSRQPASAAG